MSKSYVDGGYYHIVNTQLVNKIIIIMCVTFNTFALELSRNWHITDPQQKFAA